MKFRTALLNHKNAINAIKFTIYIDFLPYATMRFLIFNLRILITLYYLKKKQREASITQSR